MYAKGTYFFIGYLKKKCREVCVKDVRRQKFRKDVDRRTSCKFCSNSKPNILYSFSACFLIRWKVLGRTSVGKILRTTSVGEKLKNRSAQKTNSKEFSRRSLEALTIPYNQFFLNIIITLKISGDLVLKIEHNFEEL